jgi:hypothetical protein
VEDYLRQVDELYGGNKMIRRGYTQSEVKELIFSRQSKLDILPTNMKAKFITLFSRDNTKEEWYKNRGLLEYLLEVNIVFVEDVFIYNSKLISLDIRSCATFKEYVYLKICPTVVEVYMKDSIFIPNLFKLQ